MWGAMTDKRLQAAVAAGVISADQARELEPFLASGPAPRTGSAAHFDLMHVLWYAGALLIIGAMGLFSTLAFSRMGIPALLTTSLAYGLAFWWAGDYLWRGRGLTVPGGLLVTVAVSMVPLLVYSVQELMGWWPHGNAKLLYKDFHVWIRSSWLLMELATILVAIAAIRRYPFGFTAMLIAVTLWYMSMDLAPWLMDGEALTYKMRYRITMVFGLLVMAVALGVDLRQRKADYAFWLHLAGVLAFWGGLSMQYSDSELAKAVYCLINLSLIALAVFLGRRVYAVFGALGVAGYLGHLAHGVFKDSLLFPFALSLVGLGIIGLGLLYMRKRAVIGAALGARMPAFLQWLRPPHAREGVTREGAVGDS